MKKSELKEYIREAILAELSEAVFVGPGAVDDITTNAAFQKIKDKNSVINALKKGQLVALEETDDDDDSEKEPTASDLKKAEKDLGKNSKHAKKLTDAEEERYDKLKKGITAKVNKLKDMPKSERVKSDDLKVLKSLINKKEVKDLFKAKGASLDSLVSGVIG
jgi:hypothetical protein